MHEHVWLHLWLKVGQCCLLFDVAAAGRNQVNSEAHWSLSTITAKLRLMVVHGANGFAGCKSTLKSLGIKLDIIKHSHCLI